MNEPGFNDNNDKDDLSLGWVSFKPFDDKQWDFIQKLYHFSPREMDVVKLITRGNTNQQMAADLKITTGTIKVHLRNIFGKTGTRRKIKLLLRLMGDIYRIFPDTNTLIPIEATKAGRKTNKIVYPHHIIDKKTP